MATGDSQGPALEHTPVLMGHEGEEESAETKKEGPGRSKVNQKGETRRGEGSAGGGYDQPQHLGSG